MGHRASPPIRVHEWDVVDFDSTALSGQTIPDDLVWVNPERSTVRHQDGFAHGEFALLPGKHAYDHFRVLFSNITKENADNTATLTLFTRSSDGTIVVAGTSALVSGAIFAPHIEIENYQAEYAVAVTALAGSSAEISLNVSIQGVMVGYVA